MTTYPVFRIRTHAEVFIAVMKERGLGFAETTEAKTREKYGKDAPVILANCIMKSIIDNNITMVSEPVREMLRRNGEGRM